MIRPRLRLFIAIAVVLLWTIGNYFFYRDTILPGMGIRYLLAPWVLLVVLVIAGISYVQISFALPNLKSALSYFLACMFGMQMPVLVISDGKAQTNSGQEPTILKIGGPGYLVLQTGNVVLLEDLSGKIRVVGAGRHFISRLESVKEIASLEERFAHIEKLSATTKDGIEIEVRDIRYRYRLCSSPNSNSDAGRQSENLFSFSEEAVIQMTYNRTLTSYGISTWHMGVNQVVETVITDYIRQHPVDSITAPQTHGFDASGIDARGDIYREFYSQSGRNRFRGKGAELIWIDIGHFETPEKTVIEQRVNTWQARWLGNANVVRALGEAQRAASQDLGRAEAQAEMLKNIVLSLESVGPPGEARQQNMRALYLARIAQLLDAMSTQPLYLEENPPKNSSNQ
jgi:hypothetical protein